MTKLRKWLIKKLGGYTEQMRYEPPDIIKQELKVQTLQADIIYNYEELNYYNPEYGKYFVEKELEIISNKLGKLIVNNGLFEVAEYDDPIMFHRIRKYIVRVCEPER